MSNRDINATWRYHDATKHTYMSVRTSTHQLDWANQPLPLKIYRGLDAIALPTELPATGAPVMSVLAKPPAAATRDVLPDLPALAYVLYCSAGITKRKTHQYYAGGEITFRAASCTGALYEIEIYLVCQDLPGLGAGVYHFGPADFALRQLRQGDYRGELARATAGEPAVAHAPVTIVCTGTYWRNAWKYQARTYRHFGWDNGTILANMLAASAALELPARVVCGFVDAPINELLALDADREVAFSIVPLGRVPVLAPDPPPLERIAPETERVSRSELDYPIMREMHAASSLSTPEEVVEWRNSARHSSPQAARRNGDRARQSKTDGAGVIPLGLPSDASMEREALEDVVLRRGSTRRFRRDAWTYEQFSTALFYATQRLSADFLGDAPDPPTDALVSDANAATAFSHTSDPPAAPLLNDLYLIVHSVEGLSPGAYSLDRRGWSLELLKEGRFREEAGYLGLEQDLPADASFVVFFLADLDDILDRFGNRGYRAAQLEAGILGGRLYLAAYAQRLGASGLTFYDDDVVAFFSPHAAGKSAIFCMTLGKSARLAH